MIGVNLAVREASPLKILCLGAHADDIEIGCGGAILSLKSAVPHLCFHWVVLCAHGNRRCEAQTAAGLFTSGCRVSLHLKEFRDGFLPYEGGEVKDFFEELKSQADPDLIFTNWRGDAHQDHRLVSELTWNTFRNHLILEYEIPKYDGDMGQPNVFVPLEESVCQRKVDMVFDAFLSQRSKHWFGRDVFMAMMRLRGMESHSPSGYAEAFHARKLVTNFSL